MKQLLEKQTHAKTNAQTKEIAGVIPSSALLEKMARNISTCSLIPELKPLLDKLEARKNSRNTPIIAKVAFELLKNKIVSSDCDYHCPDDIIVKADFDALALLVSKIMPLASASVKTEIKQSLMENLRFLSGKSTEQNSGHDDVHHDYVYHIDYNAPAQFVSIASQYDSNLGAELARLHTEFSPK